MVFQIKTPFFLLDNTEPTKTKNMKQIDKNNYEIIINNNELFTLSKRFETLYKDFKNNKDTVKFFKLHHKLYELDKKIQDNKNRVSIKTDLLKVPFSNIIQLELVIKNNQTSERDRKICERVLKDVKTQKYFTNLKLDAGYINQYMILKYAIYDREDSKTKKTNKEIEMLNTAIDVLIEDKRLMNLYEETSKEYNKYAEIYNKGILKVNDLRNRIRAIGLKEIRDRFKVPAQKPINEVDEDYRNAFNDFDGCDVLKNGQVRIYIHNTFEELKDKKQKYTNLYTKEEVNNILKENNIDFKL